MKMAVGKFKKKSEDKQTTEKENKFNMFISFPDDVYIHIFKTLPDGFLRYNAKYVCRQWFDIITNKILLDQVSLILQNPTGIYTSRYVNLRKEGQELEVKEQYLDIPHIGTIRSWCNEFLVITDIYRKGCMYVYNLVTKVATYLPRCTSCVGCYSCQCGVALSFDNLKGVYKVLRVYMGPPMQCHILILKSEILSSCVTLKWKNIKVPDFMSQDMQNWCHPISVQGRYFYWDVHCSNYLISMDMVKEKIFPFLLPRSCGDHMVYEYYCVFEMGGFLYLIGEVKWEEADIWILKDFQRMEWEKMQSVTLLNRCFKIRHIISVVLKRYIIFKKNGFDNIMYSYDLKYGVVKELNINIERGDYFLVHSSCRQKLMIDKQVHERMEMMKKEVDPFVSLPNDILLDILKKLPDPVLRYKAKYVCKRWFDIITNTILLDDASFIIQKSSGIYTSRVVGIRKEQQGVLVKVHNLDIPFERIKSWYNEFLLIMDCSRDKSLYLFNLITNERSYLPECHTDCRPHFSDRCGVALCFDGFDGVYKVVHFFMGPPFECHVLKLGSEIVSSVTSSWKKMEIGSDMEDPDWQYDPNDLVSVQVQGRYFHWDVHSSNYLVSMDITKEEIFQLTLPGSNDDDSMCSYYSIFEMGGFLALIDGVSRGKGDIWILSDFERMKWEKLRTITVEDYYIEKYNVSYFLSPICGVIDKRYIIFMERRSRMCCCFDLENGVVKKLNIRIEFGDRYLVFVIREKLAELYESEQLWSKAVQMLSSIDLDSGMRFLLNKTVDVLLYVDRVDAYRVNTLDGEIIKAIINSFGQGIWRRATVVTKKKKNKVDVFNLLPDDVLVDIFKNVEPNLLRFKVRFVTRRWFNLITNIILLDHASFILQKGSPDRRFRLLDITEEAQGLKTKEQNIKIPFDGRIKCWCNEYLLIAVKMIDKSLYMYNLITKRASILPPCSYSCGGHYGYKCGVGLCYDESEKVYKVIHVFRGPPLQCEILIIKSTRNMSGWKKVNGPDCTGQVQYNWYDPVSVKGRYLHWDVHCPKFLVSMDTVKETFRQISVPRSDLDIDKRYCMVEIGGFLALIHKSSSEQIDIWMLKDFETDKWVKRYSISGDVGLNIYRESVVTCVRSER
ncbi:hypothetical protein LXL04_012301 [Taraxacum kok-saghyz]